jgi:hypothetical protein
MQNPNENNLPIIQQNSLQVVDNQLTITDLLLQESANSELREWWEGLLQYGKVLREFTNCTKLSEYTYQHIFLLHIDLAQRKFDLNTMVAKMKEKKYNLSADCFYNYHKEVGKKFPIGTTVDLFNLKQKINLIRGMWIQNLGLTSLTPLENLKSLASLYCNGNNIKDLMPLKDLKNLRLLDCFDNQIHSLYALQFLGNLSFLDCSKNHIDSLHHLTNLINLQYLYFSDNNTNDIWSLRNLTNLKVLVFKGNKISNLAPLYKMNKLLRFNCSDNLITDLSPLGKMTTLQNLDCSNNKIRNLSCLADLHNLEKLDCCNNPIPKSEIEKFKALHPNCTVYHD